MQRKRCITGIGIVGGILVQRSTRALQGTRILVHTMQVQIMNLGAVQADGSNQNTSLNKSSREWIRLYYSPV